MNCSNGHANVEGNRFCLECGVALPATPQPTGDVVLTKAPVGPGESLASGCLLVGGVGFFVLLFLLNELPKYFHD
ncbi:MAG: hypothetical protein KJS64_00440 [Acidobacteria bacterium]|nr:hypothetical protein [Acidobacteriota bacterium]